MAESRGAAARLLPLLERREGPASDRDLARLARALGRPLAGLLRDALRILGWGSGWIAPASGNPDDAVWIRLYQPGEIAQASAGMPAGIVVFGSNGGSELLAHLPGRGYGLCPTVGNPQSDFLPVAPDLDGFLHAAGHGGWFPAP